MDLWHKTIQKDHYHWVPKGEDPFDAKWSQNRRIPNFRNWFNEGIFKNSIKIFPSHQNFFRAIFLFDQQLLFKQK